MTVKLNAYLQAVVNELELDWHNGTKREKMNGGFVEL